MFWIGLNLVIMISRANHNIAIHVVCDLVWVWTLLIDISFNPARVTTFITIICTRVRVSVPKGNNNLLPDCM